MPISKNALARHLILDSCFSNFGRKFYIENLMEKCNGISKRQIYEDIKFFISIDGWDAPLVAYPDGKRKYYRYSDKKYSIRSKPITDEEMLQLQEIINMLSRFNDLPQFKLIESLTDTLKSKYAERQDCEISSTNKNIISIQNNVFVEGSQYISDIFNYIVNKTPIKIEYQTFHKDSHNWIIHPYFLKQYNNRWYLIGLKDDEYKNIAHIGLDRIKSLEPIHADYIENETIDSIDDYFDDVVGVSIPNKRKIEHVVLKFSPHRFPYVKAKPIHWSQKYVNANEGIISLDLMRNRELESIILNFGKDVEVIEPLEFRNEIATIIKETYEKYFPLQ